MRALEERILSEGKVLPGEVLKVGSFLNQQIDVALLSDMGKEVARLFEGSGATKILTIEASGIAFAVAVGMAMHLPVLFAKKHPSLNISGDLLTTKIHSYTHGNDYNAVLPREYLSSSDRVILADDFLASGQALLGLTDLVESAGAKVIGAAIQIEKRFQKGRDLLEQRGVRIESLAIVESMSDTALTFSH